MQEPGAAPSQKPDSAPKTVRPNPQPKAPSQAYEEARESPVHRLSELMFGSLLASYVLGFISFLAPHASKLVTEPKTEWEVCLPYLFISFTFAYLTAGLYLSYTAGILTMHHLTLKHLRSDFLLALSQAIAFGVSMVFPTTTAIWLGLVLSGALLRQRQEQRELAESFYDICKGSVGPGGARGQKDRKLQSLEKFRRQFNKLLKEERYSTLSLWRELRWYSYFVTILLLALGVSLIAIAVWGWFHPEHPWLNHSARWTLVMTGLIAVGTFFYVHRILKERATFLDVDDDQDDSARPQVGADIYGEIKSNMKPKIKMDRQFDDLLAELKTYYENNP